MKYGFTKYKYIFIIYTGLSKNNETLQVILNWKSCVQGIGIKGLRKPVALLCRRVRYSLHTLFWYRHTHMTTFKESAEQCRQL